MKHFNAAQQAFVQQRVMAIRLEVLRHILLAEPFYPGGKVPPLTLTSFGELHDYCDANTLGGLCNDDICAEGNALFPDAEPDPGGISTQGYMGAANAVQSAVDHWLASGQMVDEAGLVAKLRLNSSEIEQLCDPATVTETLAWIDDLQDRVGAGLGFVAETCDRLRVIVGGKAEGPSP